MRSHGVAHADGARCALGDPLFSERYRAIDARDTRFDGQFFTAVSSTGIYCRPSCPARTPAPRNVTFFLTSAAAHEAGYRACKRCLPEAAPGTPDWDLRRDLAARAMRLINDGVVDREGVEGLAVRLGYTARHVHRLLIAELGAGPLALARARRAQTARSLLVGTTLPMARVAFAAGFGSIRQFNDTVQAVFAARPSELRARSAPRAGAAPAGPDGPRADLPDATASPAAPVRLDLDLPVRQPFDAPGAFRFLAARAVSGVEAADLDDGHLRYARTLTLPHGPGAVEVVATPTAAGWRLRAALELASLADVAPAVARVRRMLDLDADPVAVDQALGADPHLAGLVARTPGIRAPGAVDPHELVVRAIVGQQISVAAARTHLSRLAAVAGETYASGFRGLDRLFPSPAQIVQRVPEPGEGLDPDRPLRLPRRAVEAVLATSRALADGDLDVHVGADPEALRAALVARPRIGPWTAAYVAMRVLGDPDSWLEGDVALVAGARAVGVLGDDVPAAAGQRVLADRAAAWAPWRSYAAMHLWQSAGDARRLERRTP
ncbi:AlkA N-terminal domain-containing protein [Cellulomonas chengniuliangii]|uniref:Helix-turn-helix domain-containing protein n=1 Tax=Cellulomonas chengniuliangii TaxID=2968084 RepID=A0ABY5KWA5_9CELL|nr:AlkA N-terminal domain-containing protein [Cellulomonas chengniuliangii]MCC2308651.1 helix-turn-helix domain-containing protein [Cellulomonas chengniuliangii]MCC2317668.1 helix-turn-helix domain-containing protein [Cellulomonas chengniuliangii]UUI74010.1 helix-turn-helix domain-containing protein [Cellulomonas chengniuliangii]